MKELDEKTLNTLVRELADTHPREILRTACQLFDGSLTLGFSGAEDVVLVEMAAEVCPSISIFILDTGRLHHITYQFLEEVRKKYQVTINVLSPDPEELANFIREKGFFSFYTDGHHECCRIRKVEPLRKYLHGFSAWVTGLRRDQNAATRQNIEIFEFDSTFSNGSGKLVKVNPLAFWTHDQVWAYIHERDIPFNELHSQGYLSIGCEPCTRPIKPGEHIRDGRWWWESHEHKECGIHFVQTPLPKNRKIDINKK